ncbi:NAD(P)-binding protein [Apiospora kogelbergensis]|uniref:3-dehydrosphinganine reductase n=1 Tax=Apiospora kogelbergensis TaxID=1337665 RepID=A0AAW0QHA9_9PEZI
MGLFGGGNHMPVEGKTILVTGATEGMGRCAARQLAAKGANVIVVSRNVARLEETVAEIKSAAKNPQTQRFHYISADVSKPDYARSLIAEAVAWNHGKSLDIVWCIAGKSTPDFWFEAPLSLSREQMDINYWGSAEMAHAILREWCAPDAPVVPEPKHLIFTASVVAFFPVIGYGPYSPPKAALRALADSLVQELEMYPQNVKVHVVFPGGIKSPGFDRENQTKPEITKIIEADDPVQTPEEVASKAIQGLESGNYFVTVGLLGSFLKWGAMGGSPRNSWIVDTVLGGITQLAWMFALPDIYGKIRKFAKQNGHPSSYRNKANGV